MMKINALCGRCGKPVETKAGITVMDTDTVIGTTTYMPATQRKSFLLCLKCSKEFREWMYKGEKQ